MLPSGFLFAILNGEGDNDIIIGYVENMYDSEKFLKEIFAA